MNLHYQSYGEGFPLIVLHGLFGMLDNWHTVSRMLGEHFRVYALDQRNHGRSPHSSEFNYEVMSNDVREFMTENRIPKSYLLGHSMGGKTAMWTALKYPETVERLIIIDIAPRAYPSLHDIILDALESLPLTEFTTRQEIDRSLASMIPELPVRQFLMKNLSRNDDGSFYWKMNLSVISSHYSEIMRGVETQAVYSNPTLFIRSKQSSYIADTDLPAIKRLFPSSSIVAFDTGHWVHAEAPEQLTKTVTRFLLDA